MGKEIERDRESDKGVRERGRRECERGERERGKRETIKMGERGAGERL